MYVDIGSECIKLNLGVIEQYVVSTLVFHNYAVLFEHYFELLGLCSKHCFVINHVYKFEQSSHSIIIIFHFAY